ncbi:hypothetical protein DP42_965 [Burkholderia pseudomallei]|nr:hypothetical protein DP42_965 [Burkholderia pseudomallei]
MSVRVRAALPLAAALALAAGFAIGTAHAANVAKGKELVESHNCAARSARQAARSRARRRASSPRIPPSAWASASRCRPRPTKPSTGR